jgi:hypothetical protein
MLGAPGRHVRDNDDDDDDDDDDATRKAILHCKA